MSAGIIPLFSPKGRVLLKRKGAVVVGFFIRAARQGSQAEEDPLVLHLRMALNLNGNDILLLQTVLTNGAMKPKDKRNLPADPTTIAATARIMRDEIIVAEKLIRDDRALLEKIHKERAREAGRETARRIMRQIKEQEGGEQSPP
jgi:hypothetical protein